MMKTRAIESLPLALPVALAAFGAVATFFLLIGQLKDIYVWPLGLLAAFAAAAVVARHGNINSPGSPKEKQVCGILAITGFIIWVGFNVFFSSQHVFTNRDPATYANAGGWLINHTSLSIDASNVFGNVSGVEPFSAGFGLNLDDPHLLNAQGAHLLPILLGLFGRVVGPAGMLHLNVLFGGIALLAVYAFARLMMKPRWALIAASCLALSLPLIYFSRDTYSEPLALAFTFSALALIWLALKTKKYSLWFLAGLVTGAGALTRIDAYLTVAAVMAFVAVYLALSARNERKKALRRSGLLLVGMAVTSILGWLDVSRLSNNYYASIWPQFRLELLLMLAVVALGALVVTASWRTGFLAALDAKTRSWRAPAAAILILIMGLGLAARPLLYTAYSTHSTKTAAGTFQTVTTRNYSEETVNWVAWYIGPIVAAAGLGGLMLASGRAVRKRNLLLVAPILIVLATSLLYLINPKIARDQIWAARRFLPVILPGIAVFAGLGFQWLYEQKYTKRLSIDGKTLTTVLVTLAVITPLFISMPFMFTRERGQ